MVSPLVPRRIRLREYGSATVVPAADIDIKALAESNLSWRRRLKLTTDPFKWESLSNSQISLRAQGITGVIRIGNTDLEIVPKFLNGEAESWQSILWQILMVVEGGYVDDTKTAAHESNDLTLPDLLAEVFLTSYSKGASRGLPRGYRTHSSSGSVLRGQLDLNRIGLWISKPWVIPFNTDLFTDDTAFAQLLRWTADQLASSVASSGRARKLREIAGSLSYVNRQPPHIMEARKIQLGVQYRALDPALVVGKMLLEKKGIQHAKGNQLLSGFLWNSDVIYENFIFWLCSRAAERVGGKVSKNLVNFGELLTPHGMQLQTTPDVVFRTKDGRAFAVTDAKYKSFGKRPKAADTYQVLTAGHILGCQRVSLTYPVGEERKPTIWRVSSMLGGQDIELSALPMNLMLLAEPGGQVKLIETFVDWLQKEMFQIEKTF